MTKTQIEEYLTDLENQLLNNSSEIKIELTSIWANSFSNQASVFLFREDGVICYVAETSSIKEEINGIFFIKNHAFRRSFGEKYCAEILNYKKSSFRNGFSEDVEALINERMVATLTLSYILVDLGRRELEVLLNNRFLPKYIISLNKFIYKTYGLNGKEYKNAYLPWTVEDDNKLEVFYCQGKTVKELMEIFGRNNGAIRSRIRNLKFKEKYRVS